MKVRLLCSMKSFHLNGEGGHGKSCANKSVALGLASAFWGVKSWGFNCRPRKVNCDQRCLSTIILGNHALDETLARGKPQCFSLVVFPCALQFPYSRLESGVTCFVL